MRRSSAPELAEIGEKIAFFDASTQEQELREPPRETPPGGVTSAENSVTAADTDRSSVRRSLTKARAAAPPSKVPSKALRDKFVLEK